MAKFFVCHDEQGQVFDCTLTFAEAKQIVKAQGKGSIVTMDVILSGLQGRKNVAALLGNHGGYAKNIKHHEVR